MTQGHCLIISRRHRADFFELNEFENSALLKMIRELKVHLLQQDPSIEGFNIGMNCGKAAGQTIFHFHLHLIPRRTGDCENPAGGVRGVIPGKQAY